MVSLSKIESIIQILVFLIEPLRNVVFEEESISFPIIATRHGHIMFDDTIQNVQPIIEIADTPEIPPIQVVEPIQVHKEVTQQPQ